MKSILYIFFNTAGTRPWLVLGCLLLAGFSEAVGITSLLPALGILTDDGSAERTAIARTVLSGFEALGIEPTIGPLVAMMIAGLCTKAVLTFVALSYAGWSAAEAQATMRAQLLSNLLDARWSFFTSNQVGTIANSMSTDATRVSAAFMLAGRFVAHVVQATIYIAIAVAVSWKLALVGVAIGSAITVAMGGLTKMTRKAGQRQTDNTSLMVSYVSDAFNNIKAIKTMNRYSVFTLAFNKRLRKLRKALRTVVVTREAMSAGKELTQLLMIGAGAFVATVVWKTPVSETIVFGIVFFQVVTMVGKLQITLQRASELESAYWRLKQLIDRAALEREDNPGTKKPKFETACRFEEVSFAHGDTPVVDKVTLEIPARGITVLRGPSGAGKTTIIDLLTGLYRPDGGRILIDGVPLSELDLREWRRCIGYVPQEINLLHDTVLSNVTMGDESISEEAAIEAMRTAGALDFVERLPDGVHTLVGERGSRLSGGERQRISLARALAVRPGLLILDEVTSALDPDTERAICENIREIAGDYAIVAITHRPAWSDIADRLYDVRTGSVRKARPKKREARGQASPA